MLTPTTNSSGKELQESVIFQPVLQAYPTHHSWIIMAHVSPGHQECHWKAFNRQLARTWQLLHFLDQQPSALTQLLSIMQVELTNIEDIHLLQNNHNICNWFITHQSLFWWTITVKHLPHTELTAFSRRCPQMAYGNCNYKTHKQH